MITLNEAIKILSESAYGATTHDEKFREAVKLGAEALKNLRNQRATGIAALDYILLGEEVEGR
jgi:hypothetical protein